MKTFKVKDKEYPFTWSPTLRAMFFLSVRLGRENFVDVINYFNETLQKKGDLQFFKSLIDIAAAAIQNAGIEPPDEETLWLIMEDMDNVNALISEITQNQKKN